MSPTLYDIADDYAAIERMLVESEGEITPEIEMRLAALDIDMAEKVDGYRCMVVRFEMQAKAIDEDTRLLAAKKSALVNAATRLKDRLKAVMESRGVTELRGLVWKAAIQKNGGKAALTLLVEGPEALPPAYQIMTVTADSDAIRQGLKDGSLPAGLAELQPVGSHLRFR